jgi:hypothetical protein
MIHLTNYPKAVKPFVGLCFLRFALNIIAFNIAQNARCLTPDSSKKQIRFAQIYTPSPLPHSPDILEQPALGLPSCL